MTIALLLLGFVLLVFGADILVKAAASIAKRFNVPDLVIGLTIVAFGTSAPELLVNIMSALNGNTEMALGNVVGSNIFNTSLILGVTAIMFPIAVKSSTTWIEVPLSILAAAVVWVCISDILLDQSYVAVVSRTEGMLCIGFFLIFLAYMIQSSRSGAVEPELPEKTYGLLMASFLLISGLVLLILGGNLIVDNAVQIAGRMGIPERIIGLTIVSAGTSLPELATSLAAARRKNVDMAIGNVVGSNIFNIFLILGTTAIINPVSVVSGASVDALINLGLSCLLFLFLFTGKGRKVERWEGVIFVLIYGVYLCWLIIS